jgi:hypothetical protein
VIGRHVHLLYNPARDYRKLEKILEENRTEIFGSYKAFGSLWFALADIFNGFFCHGTSVGFF